MQMKSTMFYIHQREDLYCQLSHRQFEHFSPARVKPEKITLQDHTLNLLIDK
jgi:hypothetical protein